MGKQKFNRNKTQGKNHGSFKEKKKKWQLADEEIKSLESKYSEIDSAKLEKFRDIPLSKRTQDGLRLANYHRPTDIQRQSIGLALQSHDILGAAKTGSGKTLAFLIPILERLFRQKWSTLDGVGALIISPTRELAYQTFEVLRKIGAKHDFSAGLVIGGKHLREESASINKTNIVICTPGRLLQHMDETFNFNVDNLQILVLDEADRILDLGFQDTMNAIIENLPQERQTLLFSATQTKSVKDLARLSLRDPMYVSVHEHSKHSTPSNLTQSYIVCELHEKLNVLWSFVKNHLKKKILVFLQSCKQVRFIYESFCRLRPGQTVLALHGGMHQLKRVASYDLFCRKQSAVMFATDIAARGLDFPAVHWVIQLDCPEDANTYIHRAGRTARYEKGGESLLILTPSEETEMIKQLEEKKIPINKIKVNQKKLWSIQPKLESMLAADPTLKEMAQRAFVAYLRSVYLMSNKAVFDVHKLDTDEFSRALGLAMPPRIRFLQREQKRLVEKEKKKATEKVKKNKVKESSGGDADESEEDDEEGKDDAEESEDEVEGSEDDAEESENEVEGSEDDAEESEDEREEDMKESEEESSAEDESEGRPVKVKGTQESSDDEESEEKESSDEEGSDEAEDDGKKLDQKYDFSVEDDEDDLFTVKKVELESDEETLEPIKKESKKLTKFALAKKLQKKNIKVNTKVVFDEEGEVVVDPLKTQTLDGDDDAGGGLNISVARQRMVEEDIIDKKLYQERIKKQHREKRLKEKERRREERELKRQQRAEKMRGEKVVAVLGGVNDEDETTSQLSASSDEPDSNQSDTSDDDRPTKRMKREIPQANSSSSEEESEEEEEESREVMDTGLTLGEDEELALKLLQS